MMKNISKSIHRSAEINPTNFYRLLVILFLIIYSSPLFETEAKLALVLISISGILYTNKSLSRHETKWLFITILCFLPAIIIDIYWASKFGEAFGVSLYMLLNIIFAILIASRLNINVLLRTYENSVLILTIISLSIYIVFINFQFLINYSFSYDYYGFPGKSLFIQNFMIVDDIVVPRNPGFSSEPGIFQIFINLAVVISFYYKNMNFSKLIIYAAGIASSGSTAGIVIFVFLVIISSNLKTRIMAFGIGTIFTAQLALVAAVHYQNKILNENAFLGRLEPTLNALETALEHPFGLGSVRYSFFLENLNIGSFDTYSQIYIRFGITALVLFVILLMRVSRKNIGIAIVIGLSAITNNVFIIPSIALFLFIDYDRLKYKSLRHRAK